MKTLFHRLMLMSALIMSSSALAEELSIKGFVAQGITQSSDSNFINDDGDVSLELTEIGLNTSYRLTPSLRLAGQVVYLNGANRYPEGPRLDYLFLDWNAVNSLDWQANIKLGRIKNYHWAYSATRDVPHTRPTIFLPQSIYFDVFRDVALASDGASFSVQTSGDSGVWELNWSYGKSSISEEQTKNLLNEFATGDLKQKYDHQMSMRWQLSEAPFELGFSLLDSQFDYHSGINDPFTDGGASTKRLMLYMRYDAENWNLVSELLRERVVFENLLFPGFVNNATAEGGYVQGQYRLSEDISLVARLDVFDRDRKDRRGRAIEELTAGIVPGYFSYQDTATLGIQWDIDTQWRLQAEYHRVKGTGRLAPVLSPNIQINKQKYWDVWAMQLMYWF